MCTNCSVGKKYFYFIFEGETTGGFAEGRRSRQEHKTSLWATRLANITDSTVPHTRFV